MKKRRATQAGKLGKALQQRYLERLVGQRLEVLFEEAHDGLYQGHAPNYVLVKAPAQENLHNQLRTVSIQEVGDGFVTGVLER